ncbi:Gfo/Idh/MocA family protein [Microbacterium rhizomatis]|uniref:Gfo/Idh/MocA family oxidoreductase n=1 Tax=Microbacterium rhizomatis TaxID=1631477 RepID=A0A5J5IX43_9MICO|nr:Gfo/Idh/MocA family oxidoreductase [Microbacterium rhizomatis]KAA9105065.1 Gfo/Idh/MocA family oxidoreductase [Microbacterium rhizomatis]
MPYGVGVIGAGPGAAALHLPTLARFTDRFRVVHIADAGSGRAAHLAERVGASASTGITDALADSAVEVVLLCTPPHEHAEQILAAVSAGKRGVIVEKPLATTHEAAIRVVDACRDAGTALLVGTNHLFDPAWERTKHHLIGHSARVQTIGISVALPPNGRLHDLVTESAPATAAAGRGAPDWSDPRVAAAVVRQLVLGLAVHDLPLVRDLAPRIEQVVYARPVPPIGYAIGYRASGVLVQLTAVMLPGGADALWRMRVTTPVDVIDVEFPPAFVHAGSAAVTVRGADGAITAYPREPDDGYVREWAAFAGMLDGHDVVEYDELLDDAHYAIDLADAAALLIEEGGR